jgi:hypothetical protein
MYVPKPQKCWVCDNCKKHQDADPQYHEHPDIPKGWVLYKKSTYLGLFCSFECAKA